MPEVMLKKEILTTGHRKEEKTWNCSLKDKLDMKLIVAGIL